MATEQQLIKLEKIQKITKEIEKNKEIPKALSRGHIGYEKAIRSVMWVGMWAVASSIIAVGVAILFLSIKWILVNGGPKDYEIYLSIFSIICSITSGVLGYKLWNLEATPLFTLFALIFILLYNLLLVIGIIPLITVVIAIVALSRYGTFCNWFDGV